MPDGRLRELAAAKVNLTLRVLGRRADGYHELASLVAFAADAGDTLTLSPMREMSLEVSGRDAPDLSGDGNLVLKAARAVSAAWPACALGAFRLEKRLPVAAGLGGGSADAAAALRLMQRANRGLAARVDWVGLAVSLGADVPVCLASRAAVMSGLGELVAPLGHLPPGWIVLANPGVPLSTALVFAELRAAPVEHEPVPPEVPNLRTFADLRDYAGSHPNDLEATARRLCPAVDDALGELRRLAGAALVRMSGSGPTCFALFASEATALAAAGVLASARPDWWVAASALT